MTSAGLGEGSDLLTPPPVLLLATVASSLKQRSCDQGYLAKGSRSSVGAEEATEAAGGPVLPALRSNPDTGQGATDLPQSIRGGNIGLPQELCNVLPPSCLTLDNRRTNLVKKAGKNLLKFHVLLMENVSFFVGGGYIIIELISKALFHVNSNLSV